MDGGGAVEGGKISTREDNQGIPLIVQWHGKCYAYWVVVARGRYLIAAITLVGVECEKRTLFR